MDSIRSILPLMYQKSWPEQKTKLQQIVMELLDTMRVASGPLEALIDSWDSWTHFNGQTNVNVSLLEQLMIGSGLEYWYDNTFALRGGFYYEDPNNGDRKYITFGAGLRYNAIGVDFSYIKTLESDHPLANTLRFSLLVDF